MGYILGQIFIYSAQLVTAAAAIVSLAHSWVGPFRMICTPLPRSAHATRPLTWQKMFAVLESVIDYIQPAIVGYVIFQMKPLTTPLSA